MTWIRLDTDFPGHERIGALAEALDVSPDQAAMTMIRLWCACAMYRPDGLLSPITDTTLELWARWTGTPGSLAPAVRRLLVDPDTGKLSGWWRQEALLRHQEEKRNRRKTGNKPAPVPRLDLAANDNDNGYVNRTTSVVVVERAPANVAYLTQCVVALNAGLRSNPLLRGTHREISTSEQQGTVTWEQDQIPIAIAVRVVQELAAGFRPTSRNRQPHSLKYFDAAVRKAAEVASLPALPSSRKPLKPLPEVG